MQSISVLEAENATLAQLVEQRIRNAQVEGSNPLSGSLTALDLRIPGGFCLWYEQGSITKNPSQNVRGFLLWNPVPTTNKNRPESEDPGR